MGKHWIPEITCSIPRHSKLEIRDSFILLLSFLFLADDEGMLCPLLLAASLHEFGHYIMMRICGGQLVKVTLSAVGGEMRYRMADGRWKRCAVAASGPALNLLLAYWASSQHIYLFAGANLLLGLFNLLPVRPLDGGTIVQLCFAHGRGIRFAQGISLLCAAVLMLFGVWFYRNGGGIWLFVIASFLLISQKACKMRNDRIY